MKSFFKNFLEKIKAFYAGRKKAVLVAAGVAVVAAGLICGLAVRNQGLPKFQDVTIELGTASLGIDSFMTEHARPGKCAFVSDVSGLDIGRVGSFALTLRHGKQEQTVSLNIVDTIPPRAEFLTERCEVSGYMPRPEDFVVSVEDLSPVTVRFAQEIPEVWEPGDKTLTVIVTDAGGNELRQECRLSCQWLATSVELELGTPLTKQMVLLNPEKDEALVGQSMIDNINACGPGEYVVVSRSGDTVSSCKVTVSDTVGPVLKLQPVAIHAGGSARAEDFIVGVEDLSGVAEVRMLTEPDFITVGEQIILFEAEDTLGNISTEKTLLRVGMDMDPPVISGLTTLKVEKGSTPDYYEGVSAWDKLDGSCRVRCNADDVDTSKSGYYYVTYTAVDSKGNVATARRKVEVLHDAEDTAALVNRIAASLPSDPEALRDYVRNTIGYSSSWGEDDPVWYGFNQRTGNCYVHALCLKVLLDYYGYENQLIWVKDQSHYWLLIKLDGVWRHIDATPSTIHSRYSLMTDEQRYETLKGRDWDREKWPVCE